MAKAAIAEIQDLGVKNWQFQAGARQAFREERFLAMWKKTDKTPTGSRFKDLGTLSSDAHLSVFDIADIIRLYGAIVESSAKTGLSYAKEWDKDKSSYRRGIGNVDQSSVWGKDIKTPAK
ncbi:MAG TPA: hypothetical protein VMX36_12405 [Sedimentisphaerales bacterium]|nr:hypothetical protein [Sedimentisphaerales bacterium]